ncbi:MAG: AtpZ/AtpI family protein [Deltaproteobacteria bacterium]|nr:MAG: AtpZ/AtpI family protein [Deltaproteobacteria bacterium]
MAPNQRPKGNFKEWMRYSSLGIEMAVSVLIGAFGGYGLGALFHTKPWLMIVGFILGSVAGFRSLFRLLDQENKKKD